jgi:anti-sigma factor RsiW
MKTCQENREEIALLAMDALDIQRERELRAHLDGCAECQAYLKEMSSIAGRLRSAEPESGGQPSEAFHRNLMGALAQIKRESAGLELLGRIQAIWNWRVALPAATVAVVLLGAWFVIGPRDRIEVVAPLSDRPVATSGMTDELEPTFANYEMAAHQSLDKLDELLTKQGNRNADPSPVYTAARLPRSSMAD